MKGWEIFRFEFTYQVRRAWPWLCFAVLLALDFLMTRDGSLSAVLYADFLLNAPFAVAKTTVFGSLVWLVMAAAVAGDAAARDVATGMHPLTYTTPVSKAAYLGGRFLAALALNALILLAVPAGILLGVYLPGVDAELIGPFRPAAFLTAYAFIALPNAFVATAIQFALAARSGRPMAGYFGSFLLVFMGFFVASTLLFRRGLGTLLDPVGIRFIVEDVAHLWTTVEKNRRLLALEGLVLHNRLLWLGVALATLSVTYLGFRFAHRTTTPWWGRLRARSAKAQALPPAGTGIAAGVPIAIPPVPRTFGFATPARQVRTTAWASFRAIATSWAGLALLAVIPLLTVPVVIDQMESNGVPLVPTTIRVIGELTGPLSDELSRWVIIPFLIVYFAGELVWRERDAGLGEITDAMPGSAWAPFLGKFLGLGLVLALFLAFLAAAGMLAQGIRGYYDFQTGLYLKILFGLQLTDYLLFALLALVVHVVVNGKYTGHLAAILAYVFIALASLFGVEHNLLIYGAGPGWTYAEMPGFGPSLGPWLWFKGYWAAWALLLAVAARLGWVRGRESGLRVRLRSARRRCTRPTALVAAAATGLILLLGGFIFYNTNVRNEYLTAAETKERAARYERRYGRYADRPQPRLTATTLHVEIYPRRRAVDIRGTYRLVNRSAAAIDSIHVATAPGTETRALAFSRPAARVRTDAELHHRIYALATPLPPGDSLRLDFRVRFAPKGFGESGADASVVGNGTYFQDDLLPGIGYRKGRELISPGDRREHGLALRPLIASLYDVEARQKRGGPIVFEAVVDLRRTWQAGDRRYFHYATGGPVGAEAGYAFFSARYAVHAEEWRSPGDSRRAGRPIAIRIFHHPGHTAHLDGMLRSIRASLDYYTRNFGPYPRGYLTVVERPGNGTGMHADAGMITHAEGFTFWNPEDDPGGHDHPYAIVAHEMAHQWTVPLAAVEGAPVMSESIAWYYGLKLVEHARGRGALRQLRHYMRQPYPYPAIRRGEPLLRGLDQYLSYRRGPFALYALSEYLGAARVNEALRRLLEKHRRPEAPLATTLDLYGELRAVTPDSLRYLLHDLFEVNTYWALETERATAEQTPAGAWRVTLQVRARKTVADSAGVERAVPMDDWIAVGVFAPAGGRGPQAPLYLQKHRIRAGRQTITVTVPAQPARAGLDPDYLLIDLKTEDNVIDVKP
jgi:ABC-type transport system involved in multi-copper enzyme maturation permease subunit